MNKKDFELGLGEMFRFIKHGQIDTSQHNLKSIKEAYENRDKPAGRAK